MKISVIGLGFVGMAMYEVFKDLGCEVYGFDINPELKKNSFKDCLEGEILFLALPTPYNSQTSSYDLDSIRKTLSQLDENNFDGIIVLKSTMTPGSTKLLESEFENLNLIHNPEFLTARTAKEDFRNQNHIVLGYNSKENLVTKVKYFYQTYFPNSDISLSSTCESESMKIFVNCFYAVKVQFMNELYLTCEHMDTSFEKVISMMIKNGWINPMHTKVPGPDGKLSYGGYCFPKDTNALNEFMKKNNIPNGVLNACIDERNKMREDNDNIL